MRLVRFFILLSLLFAPPASVAESWVSNYGEHGGAGTAIMAERDGTLWVAGTQPTSTYAKQIWFAHIGLDGKALLERSITKTGAYGNVEIAPAKDGMWIATELLGSQPTNAAGGSLPTSKAWLARVGSNGHLSLERVIADYQVTQPQAMTGLSDGGVLIAGHALTEEGLDSKGWLSRLDSEGHTVWSRLVPEAWWINAMLPEQDGRFIVAGTSSAADKRARPWLAEMDANGKLYNMRKLDFVGAEAWAVWANDGLIWLGGRQVPPACKQCAEDPATTEIAWFAQINRNGDVRSIALPGMVVVRAIASTRNGNIAVAGDSRWLPGGFAGEASPVVAVLSKEGELLSMNPVPGVPAGEVYGLTLTPDGGLAATGLSNDGGAWVGRNLPVPSRQTK